MAPKFPPLPPIARQKVLINLSQRIMERFQERDVEVEPEFIMFVVQLLAHDLRHGLVKHDLNKLSVCTLNNFMEPIVNGFTDPTHSIMANMKMAWIIKTGKEIDVEYVRQLYEQEFQQQLQLLIHDILQYPETCSKVQLDQLFAKMQVFIVVSYKLGCPKNHVLLKLAAQALNSVIGRSDLQNYVLKKKYHRLEYLQRLAATVGGILIYNNDGPDGDRENVQYVINDLEMAQRNTEEAFEAAFKRVQELRSQSQAAIAQHLHIDAKEHKIVYMVPLEKLHNLNDYTISYTLLERCLRRLQESYDKTVYLIEVEQKRYDCVVAKINDTLSMRTAIDSELIFPHFVYLSKVWTNLNNFLNHIVELNKLRERLEALVSPEMEQAAEALDHELHALGKHQKFPQERSFAMRVAAVKDYESEGNFTDLAQADIKEFCALILAITDGLLLPAEVDAKLCMNLDIKFGFTDDIYLRVAQMCFEDFITGVKNVIFSDINMALLFNLADEMISRELEAARVDPPKTGNYNSQTEMVITNDLSVPNWINVTWNVWDYHRETIHMAEIRKRQTHDSQTKISFGTRNAQNQTYNTRQHL